MVDWLFLALLVLCVANGVWQGAYLELLSLVHFILSLIIATVIHVVAVPQVLHHLGQTYFNSNLVYGVSLVIIFIVTWLVLKVLFSLILMITKASDSKTPLARVLGGILGVGKGAILILLVVMVADYTFFAEQNFWQESQVIKEFTPFAQQTKEGLIYVDDFARKNIDQLIRSHINQ